MSAVPQQINLYDPGLRPRRESFTARQLLAWLVIAVLGMGVMGWWAVRETRELRHEISGDTAPAAAAAQATSVQQLAGLERALRERQAQRDARLASRDALKRGMAAAGLGPSGVMRVIADTIPGAAWISEIRVAGARLELGGRTLDPAAVDAWLEGLRSGGLLAAQPAAGVRVERVDPGAAAARTPATYTFHVSGMLAAPFADDGSRP